MERTSVSRLYCKECSAYLDIEEVFGEDGRTVIDGNTLTIELATKHLGGDWHAEHIAGELTMSVHVVDTSGSFEDLIFK